MITELKNGDILQGRNCLLIIANVCCAGEDEDGNTLSNKHCRIFFTNNGDVRVEDEAESLESLLSKINRHNLKTIGNINGLPDLIQEEFRDE